MMTAFSSLDQIRDVLSKAPAANDGARTGAQERNGQLTKPPGALGRLEDLAIWYASWQGNPRPKLEAPQVLIFAGNHGVAAQGVSAFPPEVTEQMVFNFQAGGAAINQLCKAFDAKLDVFALDLDQPTHDFTTGPAMDEAACATAFSAGWNAVDPTSDLIVTGEMGIGNTTSAAAICTALFGGAASDWTGAGTGVTAEALDAKTAIVAAGVAQHGGAGDGLDILAALGGRELAAMAGAIASARAHSIPVLLDGFICSAAAACLAKTQASALDHAVAAHLSAEGAHANLLKKIDKEPLLSLGLRLGEGSGAALAIGILKGAIACHSGMATFAEAGVADG
ncbi:MAG: nicotinate-nucleotide--dimethylbenzimidazole phosphoribosyltransferase [Pseudomonadota bacterium]